MNKYLLMACAVLMVLASCSKTSYKKTRGGMPYKIFRSKDTQQVVPGDYVKLSVIQKINDSVTITTTDGVPVYLFVSNTNQQPYDISELWTSLHLNDSLITIQMMDTFIKRSPRSVPPQFKSGDRVTTMVKVLQIFSNDSLVRADEEKGRKDFLATEVTRIEKYLSDHKITAEKTPSGAFVQTIKPGEGNLIDTGNYVTFNYTGTSWSGKKFDSNTDPSFNHTQPYSFLAGTQQMIKGFDEAIMLMRKGGVAKFYIPSTLGYGPQPNSPNIKPYESLIFDVEVTNVQEKMPAAPNTAGPGKKLDTTQQK